MISVDFFLTLFFFNLFIYLFLAVLGLRFCEGFLQLWQEGATLHRGARASHYRDLPCCGAQAPDAQAQQLWLTGLVAPRHVGSSQTRAQTCVPCIGRQTLNHCATREAPISVDTKDKMSLWCDKICISPSPPPAEFSAFLTLPEPTYLYFISPFSFSLSFSKELSPQNVCIPDFHSPFTQLCVRSLLHHSTETVFSSTWRICSDLC